MGTLIFAIALALVLGFAAHRASVCTVRAVAEIMSSASGSIFLSIDKSMLWAWALMIPVFALTPAAGTGLAGWSLTGIAVLGGFLVFLSRGSVKWILRVHHGDQPGIDDANRTATPRAE